MVFFFNLIYYEIDVPTAFKSPSSSHFQSPQWTIHGTPDTRHDQEIPGPGTYNDRLDNGYMVLFLFNYKLVIINKYVNKKYEIWFSITYG